MVSKSRGDGRRVARAPSVCVPMLAGNFGRERYLTAEGQILCFDHTCTRACHHVACRRFVSPVISAGGRFREVSSICLVVWSLRHMSVKLLVGPRTPLDLDPDHASRAPEDILEVQCRDGDGNDQGCGLMIVDGSGSNTQAYDGTFLAVEDQGYSWWHFDAAGRPNPGAVGKGGDWSRLRGPLVVPFPNWTQRHSCQEEPDLSALSWNPSRLHEVLRKSSVFPLQDRVFLKTLLGRLAPQPTFGGHAKLLPRVLSVGRVSPDVINLSESCLSGAETLRGCAGHTIVAVG